MAKDALKLAQKRAKAFGVKIEVVKSVTRDHPLDHSVIQAAEEELEWEIQNHFNGDTTSYKTRLLISSRSSGKNLVWFAELEKVDEIIIGDKKRSKVGKFLVGSSAQHVILNAFC